MFIARNRSRRRCLKRARCGGWPARKSSPHKWATRAARAPGCAAPSRSFKRASLVRHASFTSGRIVLFGRKDWTGPAAFRPFKKGVYHNFAWRGWYDFGTGALGDMACHTVNMPFRALKLGFPTAVELEVASRIYPETFPLTSRIRFDFPAREGLPPCKFWWYDGNPNSKHNMFNQGNTQGPSGDFVSPLRPSADLTSEIVSQRGDLPAS